MTLAEQVLRAFRDAAILVGIQVRYLDPDSGVSRDLVVIPQETDWESLGPFAAADSGRTRTWLAAREDLLTLPEPGHLITEMSPSDRRALLHVRRSGTYVLTQLTGSRVYELLQPSEVLLRIHGKLHDDSPLG